MIDIVRLKRAIEVQKDKIVEKIILKSENDDEVSNDELEILENYLETKNEEE